MCVIGICVERSCVNQGLGVLECVNTRFKFFLGCWKPEVTYPLVKKPKLPPMSNRKLSETICHYLPPLWQFLSYWSPLSQWPLYIGTTFGSGYTLDIVYDSFKEQMIWRILQTKYLTLFCHTVLRMMPLYGKFQPQNQSMVLVRVAFLILVITTHISSTNYAFSIGICHYSHILLTPLCKPQRPLEEQYLYSVKIFSSLNGAGKFLFFLKLEFNLQRQQ